MCVRLIISAFLLICFFPSCKKSSATNPVSACILSHIDQNKQNQTWGIKAVEEYEYLGNLVYIYVPEIIYADMQTPVLSADCKVVCTLGGISGLTTCAGENFYNRAVFIREVWQK